MSEPIVGPGALFTRRSEFRAFPFGRERDLSGSIELSDFVRSPFGRWTPVPDVRTPALRVDLGSIKVHHVSRVEFGTIQYDVGRRRGEERELPF